MSIVVFRFLIFISLACMTVACSRHDPMEDIAEEVIRKGKGVEVEFKPVEKDQAAK